MNTPFAGATTELETGPAAGPAVRLSKGPDGLARGELEWLLWQLADSSFPTGGFAHSSGLEAAAQQGEVLNREQLASFAEAQLTQLRRFALPFVAAAHAHPLALPALDERFDQHNSNHIANRSSRAQGLAFLASTRRIFNLPALTPPCGHLPPVFGAVCCQLGLPRESTLALFTYNHLRNLIASAVRLNIVGPLEAQAIHHRLSQTARQRLEQGIPYVDDAAQTNPLLDLWQGAQDRLYSRLFQS